MEATLLVDGPEEDMAVARHRSELSASSDAFLHALRQSQGSEWACGHKRTELTTHRVGSMVMCRTCRRRRIQLGLKRIAARRRIDELKREAKRARRRDKSLNRRRVAQEAAIALAPLRPENGRFPLDILTEGVARHFGITAQDISAEKRHGSSVRARSVVAQILSERGVQPPAIARVLKRDRTTVYHALKMFPTYLEEDEAVVRAYHTCRDRVA